MNNFKQKTKLMVIAGVIAAMSLLVSVVNANIAFSGDSINSLSISSVRSEDTNNYQVEIFIQGIPVSDVEFDTDYQTLYVSARSGGMVSNDAIAGAQVVHLSFDFPANANLKNYYRSNQPNKITINIPKS